MADQEKQKNEILKFVKTLLQVNQTNALPILLNTSFHPSISHLTQKILKPQLLINTNNSSKQLSLPPDFENQMLLYSFIHNPHPSLPMKIHPLSKSSQQLFINSLSSKSNESSSSSQSDNSPSTKRKLENTGPFISAKKQFLISKKNNKNNSNNNNNDNNNNSEDNYSYNGYTGTNTNKGKCLGGRRILRNNNEKQQKQQQQQQLEENVFTEEEEEILKQRNVDIKMAEVIQNEVIDDQKPTTWEDIAGLENAKNCIKEVIIWPMQHPDLFTGLRKPPKGILLFGPPGTGKTLIGKAIAHECNATFFSISSSALTSKWIGDGEKMVKTLFAVAAIKSPSVIFIDEIDSLLTKRNDKDMEATRRIKTEFLVQLDGVRSDEEDCRVLLIGATNRPQDLDDAVLRRFVKKLYIPLPDKVSRKYLLCKLLNENKSIISDNEYDDLSDKTEGYSCADIYSLCTDASLGPIREKRSLENVSLSDLREINYNDVINAFNSVKPSLNSDDLKGYDDLNVLFGNIKEKNN